MYRKKLNHKEMKALVLKVVADCRGLADKHIKNWQPFNEEWQTIEGAVYLRLSDDAQVAVERGSLEQQIHIAISESRVSFRAGADELQDYRILHRARHHGHARQSPSRFARGLRPLLPLSSSTSGFSTTSA